jgi:phage/plasmid primase-like uncharacterized protein
MLRTAAGRDGVVSWESLADQQSGRTRMAPGDVLTIDAAQGITSSEHINAMPAGSAGVQGFKGYTAESRHKDSAWLITSDGAERREVMARRALGDARPITAESVWENVARNLARQPAKASALDFMERARDIGRGATHGMQSGFRRAEARAAAGAPRATLGGQLRAGRERRAIGDALDKLRKVLDARWQAVCALANRLRPSDRRTLQRGSPEERRRHSDARVVRARASQNFEGSRTVAERHRATRPQAKPVPPQDAAAYWRRLAFGKNGSMRACLRRAVQRRRDEGAVTVVADRLALALDERGAALAAIRQGRGPKPVQTLQEHRQGQDGAPVPQPPAARPEATVAPLAAASPAHRGPPTPSPWRGNTPGFTEADAMADFAAALHHAALRVRGAPEMDGTLRRAPVEGDRNGQTSGSYVGHLDGWPAGYIRNHRTGTEIRWKADWPTQTMMPAERAAFTAAAAARSAARTRERQAIQARAARMAHRLWAAASPARDHPYLAAKGVRAHGLRQDQRGRLLVPVQGADGRLWGVQRVGVDGSKQFLKGTRTEGGHMLIGDRPRPGAPLLVAEGYATGATLHEATGLPVAVAFNAGNLLAVARAYRAADASRPIVIAGDNDHHLPKRAVPLPNVGKEKAQATARAVGGVTALPSFSAGDRGSDWNDLAQRQGHEPVAAAVRGALDHLQRLTTDHVQLAATAAAVGRVTLGRSALRR